MNTLINCGKIYFCYENKCFLLACSECDNLTFTDFDQFETHFLFFHFNQSLNSSKDSYDEGSNKSVFYYQSLVESLPEKLCETDENYLLLSNTHEDIPLMDSQSEDDCQCLEEAEGTVNNIDILDLYTKFTKDVDALVEESRKVTWMEPSNVTEKKNEKSKKYFPRKTYVKSEIKCIKKVKFNSTEQLLKKEESKKFNCILCMGSYAPYICKDCFGKMQCLHEVARHKCKRKM